MQLPCQAHTEKKKFCYTILGSHPQIEEGHIIQEQNRLKCCVFYLHFLFQFLQRNWVGVEIHGSEVMHQWENESPSNLLQTTSEVLKVYSVEVLVLKEMG